MQPLSLVPAEEAMIGDLRELLPQATITHCKTAGGCVFIDITMPSGDGIVGQVWITDRPEPQFGWSELNPYDYTVHPDTTCPDWPTLRRTIVQRLSPQKGS